ncbi:hypothetical protein PYCC9005_001528 [Savitreella phatthalungensis]
MPRAQAGVLIECDPTVKQLILKLDEQANHSILLEDLDDYRILVTRGQLEYLRKELESLLEENTYTSVMDLGQPRK